MTSTQESYESPVKYLRGRVADACRLISNSRSCNGLEIFGKAGSQVLEA